MFAYITARHVRNLCNRCFSYIEEAIAFTTLDTYFSTISNKYFRRQEFANSSI